MTMDIKGITWVGNICQKFENMCFEVEEVMLEDTVKYIENQMQTVGESVKKIYSEVMQDLLPTCSHDLDEMVASELIEQYTDNGLGEKTFQGSEEMTVKADTKETTEDLRIHHDVDNDAIHDVSCDDDVLFKSASSDCENYSTSHARQFVESTDVEPILGSDENKKNMEMPASKTVTEITLLEFDVCNTSQSCELSNENQNHAVTVLKPASAEVTGLAAEVFCIDKIENVNTEQSSNVPVLAKSSDEKEMNMSYSSSSVIFGDTNEIPEGWSLDAAMIDTCLLGFQNFGVNNTVIDHGHKTMQQDDELKLEESVTVIADGFQLVPKTASNLETNKCLKKKRRRPFSLSKNSARKQEYEELAIWHGNNERGKGDDSVENQNKLLLPDVSESEWELL